MGRRNFALLMGVLVLACIAHPASAQRSWWQNLWNREGAKTTTTTTTTTTAAPVSTTTTTTTTVAPVSTAPVSPGSANCPCITTAEYNPVCGSNGETYSNSGRLKCAQNCGQNVRLSFYGACRPVT